MTRRVNIDNHAYTIEYPEKCPICHHHGEIQWLRTHSLPSNRGVEILFECAFQGCRKYFIGHYGPGGQDLHSLTPHKPEIAGIPPEIAELSPSFVNIFTQAEEARHFGLDQICGPGYRKAFEFLIKDYAKSRDPKKAADIEGTQSGNVVRDFVSDPRIHKVAKRALWLGNDETHYMKKWTGHDIEDLVILIRLTIDWIEIERLSDKYTHEMPE